MVLACLMAYAVKGKSNRPVLKADVSSMEKMWETKCSRTHENYCTAHPINAHQPHCHDEWGAGSRAVSWKHCWFMGTGGRYICRHDFTCHEKYSECKYGDGKRDINGKAIPDMCVYPTESDFVLHLVHGDTRNAGKSDYSFTEKIGYSHTEKHERRETQTRNFAVDATKQAGAEISVPLPEGIVPSVSESGSLNLKQTWQVVEHKAYSTAHTTTGETTTSSHFYKEKGQPMYIYQMTIRTYFNDGSYSTQRGPLWADARVLHSLNVKITADGLKSGMRASKVTEDEEFHDEEMALTDDPHASSPQNTMAADALAVDKISQYSIGLIKCASSNVMLSAFIAFFLVVASVLMAKKRQIQLYIEVERFEAGR